MSNRTPSTRWFIFAFVILCSVISLTGAHGDKADVGLKIAVVNTDRLLTEYKVRLNLETTLQKLNNDTLTILQTWSQNSLLSQADQQTLGDLMVEENSAPAGLDAGKKAKKQELLDRSKALFNESLALQTKPQLSQVESDRQKDLVRLDTETKKRIEDRRQAVGQELQKRNADGATKVDKDIRENIGKIAKKEGYNLVFTGGILLYADNDITDNVLKELNK